jgi:hypothetical protein
MTMRKSFSWYNKESGIFVDNIDKHEGIIKLWNMYATDSADKIWLNYVVKISWL